MRGFEERFGRVGKEYLFKLFRKWVDEKVWNNVSNKILWRNVYGVGKLRGEIV